jgi:retron-type reverse transcriptase
MRLTINDCLNACSIELSAIDVVNKLIYQPRKAYTTSTDERTYFEFGSNISSKVKRIVKQVRNRTFQFKPSKKIKKKTKPTKVRDIYLSTWDDKIVETWLNNSLNTLLNSWLSRNAFAYRINGFGLDSCQFEIAKIFTEKRIFAKRDIRNFFYSIDHNKLLEKLEELVDPKDYLYDLIKQRVTFLYEYNDDVKEAEIGIPFGSAIACTLSNIFLTELDKKMDAYNVRYFRYADDVLIAGSDESEVRRAADCFDSSVVALDLKLKPSHSEDFSFDDHETFEKVRKFKYLGLEYTTDGLVRLSVEKQRKIMNLFKKETKSKKAAMRKVKTVDEKLAIIVPAINDVIKDRIRSAAIIDYYLKHVTDELQLKNMDRLLAERVISSITGKPFRKGHFRIVSYGKLRELGMPSLVHRARLHQHGHLKVSFLNMHNELLHKRHMDMLTRREERINHMRMARKIRKSQDQT